MIPKCRKYNEGSSVGTGSRKQDITNRDYSVPIYEITCLCFSLCMSFLLSLPGWLFLLLPAHGRISPPCMRPFQFCHSVKMSSLYRPNPYLQESEETGQWKSGFHSKFEGCKEWANMVARFLRRR